MNIYKHYHIHYIEYLNSNYPSHNFIICDKYISNLTWDNNDCSITYSISFSSRASCDHATLQSIITLYSENIMNLGFKFTCRLDTDSHIEYI